MSTSRALAVIGKPAKAKDARAEKVGQAGETITPPVEVLRLHSVLLMAAESTIAAKPALPVLGGIHLHRVDKVGRIVGGEGPRLFLASYALETPMPSWLKDGITIEAEGLRKRVQIITAISGSPMIKLSHTKGSGFVLLSDEAGDAVFKVRVIAQAYPDYAPLFTDGSFVRLDEAGQVTGGEWEPVGISSRYLKDCGDIARMLEAALPKQQREKNGMTVRAFATAPHKPVIIDFSGWPGALLVMMPVRMANNTTSAATAALLAPATKLTLAALRAHETRQLAWADAATDPAVKADHTAKAHGFQARIAEIIARTQAQVVIAAEKPKPAETAEKPAETPAEKPAAETPKPTAEAAKPAHDEPAGQPHIRRTPIKLRKRA
jgi:hypothetical protein